jgi:ribonuclease HII
VPDADFSLEAMFWQRGYTPVAGVDEAGRGALAGPVVAAAVILACGATGYRDSKQLSPTQRSRLAEQIRRTAIAWSVGMADAAEVDRLNVLEATRHAAVRAVRGLRVRPAALVTDYLELDLSQPMLAIPRADGASCNVAAASILAKVTRDALMCDLDETLPGYDFSSHKGYGSPRHLHALRELGPSAVHRHTFRPVAQARLFS